MSYAPWNPIVDLPAGTPWLLEASAGTGKTYQLASLVLRLVGEYAVPIDRILAMTFTNAAASELRSRVRDRIASAHRALVSPAAPREDENAPPDEVLAHIRKQVANDDALAARFKLAIQSFDAAAISTIHGFSQRMLQEFAFESGHDSSLTLTKSTAEIVKEVVNDALAELWSRATHDDVRILDALNLKRHDLIAVAQDAIGAQALEFECTTPPPSNPLEASPWASLFSCLSPVVRSVGAFRKLYVEGDAPRTNPCLAALTRAVAQGQFKGTVLRPDYLEKSLRVVRAWTEAGCVRVKKSDVTASERLLPGSVKSAWKGAEGVECQSFWPFIAAYDELYAQAETFHASVEPYAGFASVVRHRVQGVLERRHTITFDALISRLADSMAKGGVDGELARRMRDRFEAVLVDEFQDTDAAQWSVLATAFLGKRRLFLIGDPKQAIYSFRGANVRAYLAAARSMPSAQCRTMGDNWRSDGAAVRAMNALWRSDSDAFGTEGVDYVDVRAAPTNARRGVAGALEFRWLDGRTLGREDGSTIGSKGAAQAIAADLAADEIFRLMRPDAALGLELSGGRARLEPQDFAILTSTHYQSQSAYRALVARGIPAVVASKGSVFASDAAIWMRRWLEAVESQGRDSDVRLAVTTPIVGWTGAELARALEDSRVPNEGSSPTDFASTFDTGYLGLLLHFRRAARAWPREGFGRIFDGDLHRFKAYPRILSMASGERLATDLRHLLELAHAFDRAHRPSPGALAQWLAEGADEDADGHDREESALRLESDARSVTVETLHASKGLEYPVVLLPFAWSERADTAGTRPVKVQGAIKTVLNLEGPGSLRRTDREKQRRADDVGESQRKLYVALTRAKHRTIVWLGPIGKDGRDLAHTAIGRLALREPGSRGILQAESLIAGASSGRENAPAPGDFMERVADRLGALCTYSGGTIAWSPALALATERDRESERYVPRGKPSGLESRDDWPTDRAQVVGRWRTTSFTALVKGAGVSAYFPDISDTSADLPPGLSDEHAPKHHPRDPGPRAGRPEAAAASPAVRLMAPGSAAYGTFVHSVLEKLNFQTGEPRDGRSIDELADREASLAAVSGEAVGEFVGALAAILDASIEAKEVSLPLGFSLRSLSDTHRLDELAFDLRLGGRSAPSADRGGDNNVAHLDPMFEALRGFPDVLPASWVTSLESRFRGGRFSDGLLGILRGAIDLVFRTHDGDRHRYFIADYKTNRIAGNTLDSYTREAMRAVMESGDYFLQALLYTVALHRELGLRLAGYNYDRHMGGFLYLFVRGMSAQPFAPSGAPNGAEHGAAPGVYADRFPAALIEAVDSALYARSFP